MKFACPSCGAEVPFRSKASVYAVCSYCQSMLVRRDVNLENLGKMAELQEDMSPLQIGSNGKFDGKGFTVVGRIRQGWKEGSWNEWYCLFDDGRDGWLGEAQGFYMMSFKVEDTKHLPKDSIFNAGDTIKLGKTEYTVDDIKDITCIGAQGELPFPSPKGRKSTSIDLTGPQGAFASLDYSDTEGILAFAGRYVEFDDLKFSNLRELDGW